MADQKISQLPTITGANMADDDKFVLVDTSGDATVATTRAEFFKSVPDIDVAGDVAVSGTVDGRDIATNIPASLGTAGQVLTVNAGATAGEWADAGGGGGFSPVSVGGTSKSLNLGSYNYFDGGTITGNTTVSFSSVPTNHRWTYSYQGATVGGEYEINTAVHENNFSVSDRESNPYGIYVSPDGYHLYIAGNTANDIFQYSMSTPYDLDTASYVREKNIASQDVTPQGVTFKSDGTKMYMVGSSTDSAWQWSLSTAWDISTTGSPSSFNTNSGGAPSEASPSGLEWSTDGTQLYISGFSRDSIRQFSFISAFDLASTATYVREFSVQSPEDNLQGVRFKPDGTEMFVVGYTTDSIRQYSLSTAWDISTASYTDDFDILPYESSVRDLSFTDSGKKVYTIGSGPDLVNQFSVGNVPTVTFPASVSGTTQKAKPSTRASYEFVTTNGGTNVNLISQNVVLLE